MRTLLIVTFGLLAGILSGCSNDENKDDEQTKKKTFYLQLQDVNGEQIILDGNDCGYSTDNINFYSTYIIDQSNGRYLIKTWDLGKTLRGMDKADDLVGQSFDCSIQAGGYFAEDRGLSCTVQSIEFVSDEKNDFIGSEYLMICSFEGSLLEQGSSTSFDAAGDFAVKVYKKQ